MSSPAVLSEEDHGSREQKTDFGMKGMASVMAGGRGALITASA
jgi:hypothetical protein